MSSKTLFICDVCGKPIESERELLFMVTITMSGMVYNFDDGSDAWTNTFHVHNDQTNPAVNCYQKLFGLLSAVKK